VARLLYDLRRVLAGLHSEVRVVETAAEIRAEFRGASLCRLVPYRELVHVQVGEHPTWETRLRSPGEYPDVVDRIVRAFLRELANRGAPGHENRVT
jgi:hypothetical protein